MDDNTFWLDCSSFLAETIHFASKMRRNGAPDDFGLVPFSESYNYEYFKVSEPASVRPWASMRSAMVKKPVSWSRVVAE